LVVIFHVKISKNLGKRNFSIKKPNEKPLKKRLNMEKFCQMCINPMPKGPGQARKKASKSIKERSGISIIGTCPTPEYRINSLFTKSL
jgi:hypothetical protein